MIRSTRLRDAMILLAALGWSSLASAGGLYVSEFATSDMGAAGAGSLARAGDASTALLNPSGMTYLDSHQVNLGLAPGYGDVQFDQDSDSPNAALGDGGSQGGLVPLLGSSYVHKISDRVRGGLAIFSVSGAALDPKSNWGGRNQVQKLSLFTLTFLPSAAVRVTDWLSLGAGPAITYGRLDWKLQGPLGGQVHLKDLDDWQVAAMAGLMLEPCDELRIGFVYQSETKFKLKGKTKIPADIPSPNTAVKLPLAQAWRMDARWQATEVLALSLGWAFEEWSALNTTVVDLGPINSRVRLGMKDSWKLRGGVHYQINESWMAQTGLSYDSSALRGKFRTAALPIDEQWRWGIGGVYGYSENTKIGFAFEYLNLGQGKINYGNLKGDYKDNNMFFLMLNVNFAKLPWDGMATF